MRLCAAQTKAFPGNIDRNITQHLDCVHAAIEQRAAVILFPELSITGYEPQLAGALATTVADARFTPFQDLSLAGNISIALGAPVQTHLGVGIGLFIYHPDRAPEVYLKQRLHADELPYFLPGSGDLPFDVQGNRLFPAICYEALFPEYGTRAKALGSQVFVASTAKPRKNVDRALHYFAGLAQEHAMHVLMINSVGPSDDFVSAGCSAAWNSEGKLMGQLPKDQEGLLLYDTHTATATVFHR